MRVVDSFDAAPAGPGVIDILDTGVLGDDMPAWGRVDERAGRAAVTSMLSEALLRSPDVGSAITEYVPGLDVSGMVTSTFALPSAPAVAVPSVT